MPAKGETFFGVQVDFQATLALLDGNFVSMHSDARVAQHTTIGLRMLYLFAGSCKLVDLDVTIISVHVHAFHKDNLQYTSSHSRPLSKFGGWRSLSTACNAV